jgi:serine protease AprX
MRDVVKRPYSVAILFALTILATVEPTRLAASTDALGKLDALLQGRSRAVQGESRVIVRTKLSLPLADLLVRSVGGRVLGRIPSIASNVVVVPNAALRALASSPLVDHVTLDRVVVGAMERTGQTVGAVAARADFGYDGAGVGVAIVDSGVTAWHDDLSQGGTGQRVARFVDFRDGETAPYDEYGHGTHVAGIVAGNGLDSGGARTGIAPGAHLIVLKVLDETGRGYISDVIAALDYAVEHRDELNIRVINLSVATGVYESYNVDPLTLAAQRAVHAGITVVGAAGNRGRSEEGHSLYAGITSPGNAPWVLTVGASSHTGTLDPSDDTMALFSSRGPTAIDYSAKPDIVAPGVGIESLSNPDSTLYATASGSLLPGTVPAPQLPYLSLTGTSMSAPVVSGIVALMLQANPSLTPNAVKAILQYTAAVYPAYDPLTEGAGFVNARGAIELARHLASPSTVDYPNESQWAKTFIWGNQLVRGGRILAGANAWASSVTWGAAQGGDDKTTWWGVQCTNEDCSSTGGKWRLSNAQPRNVVWGPICAGSDCALPWTVEFVLGTTDGETVVWGTDDGETVVWGTDDGETVVWGTACTDPSCGPVIWGPLP